MTNSTSSSFTKIKKTIIATLIGATVLVGGSNIPQIQAFAMPVAQASNTPLTAESIFLPFEGESTQSGHVDFFGNSVKSIISNNATSTTYLPAWKSEAAYQMFDVALPEAEKEIRNHTKFNSASINGEEINLADYSEPMKSRSYIGGVNISATIGIHMKKSGVTPQGQNFLISINARAQFDKTSLDSKKAAAVNVDQQIFIGSEEEIAAAIENSKNLHDSENSRLIN